MNPYGHYCLLTTLNKPSTSIVDARDIAAVANKALVDGEKHYNRTYLITGPSNAYLNLIYVLLKWN